MNRKKISTTKQTQLIAVAIIAASTLAAAMMIGIGNTQILQKVMAQQVSPSGNNAAAKEEADEYKNAAVGSSSSTTASAAEVN